MSSLVQGSAQHPIEWVQGVKRPKCETDYSPPCSTEVKTSGAGPLLPDVHVHAAQRVSSLVPQLRTAAPLYQLRIASGTETAHWTPTVYELMELRVSCVCFKTVGIGILHDV